METKIYCEKCKSIVAATVCGSYTNYTCTVCKTVHSRVRKNLLFSVPEGDAPEATVAGEFLAGSCSTSRRRPEKGYFKFN